MGIQVNESSGVGLTGGVSYNRPGSGVDLLNGTGLSFTYNVDGGNLVTNANVAGGQLLSYDSSTGQFDIDPDKFQQGVVQNIRNQMMAMWAESGLGIDDFLNPDFYTGTGQYEEGGLDFDAMLGIAGNEAGDNADIGVATIMAAIANGAGAVSDFVTDTIPNAIAGAASAVAGFVTETIPGTAQSAVNFFTSGHWETNDEQAERIDAEMAALNRDRWLAQEVAADREWALAQLVQYQQDRDKVACFPMCAVTPALLHFGAKRLYDAATKPDGVQVAASQVNPTELANIRHTLNLAGAFTVKNADGTTTSYERSSDPALRDSVVVFRCTTGCAGKEGEQIIIDTKGRIVQAIPDANGQNVVRVLGMGGNYHEANLSQNSALARSAILHAVDLAKNVAIINYVPTGTYTPGQTGGFIGQTRVLGVDFRTMNYWNRPGSNAEINGLLAQDWMANPSGHTGTQGRLWQAVAFAAARTDNVSGLDIYSLNYRPDENTHLNGRAMDINYVRLADGQRVHFSQSNTNHAQLAQLIPLLDQLEREVRRTGGYVTNPIDLRNKPGYGTPASGCPAAVQFVCGSNRPRYAPNRYGELPGTTAASKIESAIERVRRENPGLSSKEISSLADVIKDRIDYMGWHVHHPHIFVGGSSK